MVVLIPGLAACYRGSGLVAGRTLCLTATSARHPGPGVIDTFQNHAMRGCDPPSNFSSPSTAASLASLGLEGAVDCNKYSSLVEFQGPMHSEQGFQKEPRA